MMKRLYEKNELAFALFWILLYCLLQSAANPMSARIGISYAIHAIINVFLAAGLLLFLWKQGLMEKYGLCKSRIPGRKVLWYLPLIILSTSNLWNGAAVSLPLADTLCYLCTMLCVGFLEEVIFRGFLFKAMARDNVRAAVIVSSVTFGIGHLLNLVNGSGMGLVSNLFQVFVAIAIGFLYVMLFYRSGSLLPCIFSHCAINMLSAFANEEGQTLGMRLLFNGILVTIAVGYSLFLAWGQRSIRQST